MADVLDAIPTADEIDAIDAIVLEALIGPQLPLENDAADVDPVVTQQSDLPSTPSSAQNHAELVELLTSLCGQVKSLKVGQDLITVGMVESLPQQLNAFADQVTNALTTISQAPPNIYNRAVARGDLRVLTESSSSPGTNTNPTPNPSPSAEPTASPASASARKSRRVKA
jgi:hypothetical protein